MARCKHFEICGIEDEEIPENGYCILHVDNAKKDSRAFRKAFDRQREERSDVFRWMVFPYGFNVSREKFVEADFRGAIFSGAANFRGANFFGEANFRRTTFSGAVGFWGATFSGEASFGGASFNGGTGFGGASFFGAAHFRRATFSGGVTFGGATFNEAANFGRATFAKAAFYKVSFSGDVDFEEATFSGEATFQDVGFGHRVNFKSARLRSTVLFSGRDYRSKEDDEVGHRPFHRGGHEATLVDFRDVRMEKSDGLAFRHANLSRARFANTDVREIEFTAVEWPRETSGVYIYDEIARSRYVRENDEMPVSLGQLERLYRELKTNYEDRRDYGRAGDFHYREKEMRRRNPNTPKGHRTLLWIYWVLSGYSERVWPAVAWFAGIIVSCAFTYLFLGVSLSGTGKVFDWGWRVTGDWTGLGHAFDYSVRTSFLLKPDAFALDGGTRWVNTLQMILSPIVLGLLGLAIRQRVKR